MESVPKSPFHYLYNAVIFPNGISAVLVEFNAEAWVVPIATLFDSTGAVLQFNKVAKTIQCQLQFDSME